MKTLSIAVILVSCIFLTYSCDKERDDEPQIVASVIQNEINISIIDVTGKSLITDTFLSDNLAFYSENKKTKLPFSTKEVNGEQVVSVKVDLPRVKDMKVINKETKQGEILETSEGMSFIFLKINKQEEKIENKIRLEVLSNVNAAPNTLLGNGKIYIHEVIFKGKSVMQQGTSEIFLTLVYNSGELTLKE